MTADKESACGAGDTEDTSSIPGTRRSPGEGTGNPLQYSCLKNPMDRGALWATVQGVAKSQTRQSTYTHTPHTEMTENSMPAKGLSICNLHHRPFDWGALDITMFISWACQIPCLKSTHLLVR